MPLPTLLSFPCCLVLCYFIQMLSSLAFCSGHHDASTNSSCLLQSRPHSPRRTHLSWQLSVQRPRASTGCVHMESEGVRVTRPHDGIGRDTAKPKPCHKPATVPTRLLGGERAHREQSKAKQHFITGWGWPWALSRTPVRTAGLCPPN